MAKWTVPAQEIVINAAADGALTVTFPVYRNGVKQFTQKQSVSVDDQVRVMLSRAPGCVLRGFYAWSDF